MKLSFTSILVFLTLAAPAQYSMVYDINPGNSHSDPAHVTLFNNRLYFNADDGVHGRELWVYDGAGNPSLVHDLHPGSGDGASIDNYLSPYAVMHGKLYFKGNDGASGRELWSYDGINPPQLAADISPGSNAGEPFAITPFGGKLYFFATTPDYGFELWRFDTAGNTATRLSDIAPGPGNGIMYPDKSLIMPFSDKLYFSAGDSLHGEELYSYDTATGLISLVADIAGDTASSHPWELMVAGSRLYFSAVTAAYGRELYVYDGVNVPVRLTDINPGPAKGVYETGMCWYNDHLLFAGDNGASGFELYQMDTLTHTTAIIADMYPGAGSSGPLGFTVYNNRLYFAASDILNGYELWVWDGMNAPFIAAAFGPGPISGYPVCLTAWNGYLYLNAFTPPTGFELFRFSDAILTFPSLSYAHTAVKLYPNPVQDALYIEQPSADRLQLAVTDIMGRLVCRQMLTERKTVVDLKGLAAGVYLYRIISDSGIISAQGKIIKRN